MAQRETGMHHRCVDCGTPIPEYLTLCEPCEIQLDQALIEEFEYLRELQSANM